MHGRKEYLSYPFLYEEKTIVEFELATDEISSMIGHAASLSNIASIKEELLEIDEFVYHLNPSVRKKLSVSTDEIGNLYKKFRLYEESNKNRDTLFVLPAGSRLGSYLHIIRCKCKQLVRLLHLISKETEIDSSIFDAANILANYFFVLALEVNKQENIKEVPFESRVY